MKRLRWGVQRRERVAVEIEEERRREGGMRMEGVGEGGQRTRGKKRERGKRERE